MTLNTADLQRVCVDLVEVLKLKLCHPANRSSTGNDPHPDLVELIAQQYFMGTLSRMISLAKSVGNDQTLIDLECQDLRFSLSFPEETDVAQVEDIRNKAAILLAQCFNALKTTAQALPKRGNGRIISKSKNPGKPR